MKIIKTVDDFNIGYQWGIGDDGKIYWQQNNASDWHDVSILLQMPAIKKFYDEFYPIYERLEKLKAFL
jgi:hypothetical protein